MDSQESPRRCSYCGWQDAEAVSNCTHCGTPLASEEPLPPEPLPPAGDELLPADEVVDVSGIDLRPDTEYGFSYPDWKFVAEQVRAAFPREKWWPVYHTLAQRWLLQIKLELGGDYHCYESENLLLVSAEGATRSRSLLHSAESSLAFLHQQCGSLLKRTAYGKRAIIAFSDEDDYYTYISHFHRDGAHSLSSGVMIHAGYLHIAINLYGVKNASQIITHELVHNCIAHLPVPTWLHEGFAQKLEHLAGSNQFVLDHDLVEKHHSFWTGENIQQFWAGTSFYGPDEGNKLSYSLAEILVNLLADDWNRFLEFVRLADHRDAGQDAALKALDRSLGDVVGDFLGPGNWRPQRKIIADLQKKRTESGPAALATPHSGFSDAPGARCLSNPI